MRKTVRILCILVMMTLMLPGPAVMASADDFTGEWVCVAIDMGDGVKLAEYQGSPVGAVMTIRLETGGSLVLSSMGASIPGAWTGDAAGVTAVIDGQEVRFDYKDGQLVNSDSGFTAYLEKAAAAPKPGGLLSIISGIKNEQSTAPAGFAGMWKAVRYETMGYTFDITMLFPEGCVLTLREDGTGEAFFTSAYTEKFTWQESGGVPVITGSYVLASPAWNAEKGELSLSYGSNTVMVIFQREAGSAQTAADVTAHPPTAEPMPEPTTEPAPEPTAEPTPEPAPEPTAQPASNSGPIECVTSLFTATFTGEGWAENEGWRSDRADYSSVRYELKDAAGSTAASVSLSASSEEVRNYRDKLKSLNEYAAKAGKEALETFTIGGIPFKGLTYEKWGWTYAEYAARVPESGVTLMVTVEQPAAIGDNLQAIIASIAFKLPVLTPPGVDPPLPEDGAPYQPVTGSVTLGGKQLTAAWIAGAKPIIVDSIFNNQIAFAGERLYVLTGKTLAAYTFSGSQIVPDTAFAGGQMTFDDTYEYLSPGQDGTLYVSQGLFNILSVKEGAVTAQHDLSGYLTMHPKGEWGITFWVNAEPMLVRVQDGELKAEPWVLSNLSDPAKRQGRFSAISCIAITESRIYVAGTDAMEGDAHRVAAYDLDGKELFSFGAKDWTADDAFGSVTGIAETPSGILVQDGNYRTFKLFSPQGEFLGSADSDVLLGTDYPWLTAMLPAEGGAIVAAAQARKDGSGDELLIFRLSGL